MTVHCRLLGVGAMNSPRFRPAGLLVGWGSRRLVVDGGVGAIDDGLDPPVGEWGVEGKLYRVG